MDRPAAKQTARERQCKHGGVTPLRAALMVLAAAGACTAIAYATFGSEARRTMPRRLMIGLLLWSLACFGALTVLIQPSLMP